ncbi:MAG: single-stranded DNA-binding protein [Patescibacteria group bacterium]
MNKVFLIGNLTKDPEIKTALVQGTGQPLKIANLAIAVNEKKNKDGTVKVQYFNLTAFDKTAEILEKFVKKGHKICVTGSLQNRSWDKPDGTKGYATDITIQELEMLTTKMEADRLVADQIANPQHSYSSPTASTTSPSSSNTEPEPVTEDKLPVINVDELNVQMPF